MKKFNELGIEESILKAIEDAKFESPSEIQEKAIPLINEGKDVIGSSATGSGKTLAFATGLIQKSIKGNGVQGIVLTPTRELAEQVAMVIKKFSKYKSLNVTTIYGGVSINPQIMDLRRTDIIVGTPGRILDHIDRKTIDLSKVNMMVLDEADIMFDMGFYDDVRKIIKTCKDDKQMMLFSATMSDGIQKIIHRHMRDPINVSGEDNVDPKKLKQIYYDVDDKKKFSLLVHCLKEERPGMVMVFCNSKNNVDFVANNLVENKIEAIAIHGGFTQQKRSKTLEQFHDQTVGVLVCTDVAARGLDVKGVSHIYNYDIPNDSKQYVHRIGRTARAGMEGEAINLLSSRDHDNFSKVLRDNDLQIPKEDTPIFSRANILWKGEPRRNNDGNGYSRGPPRHHSSSQRNGRDNHRRHVKPRPAPTQEA